MGNEVKFYRFRVKRLVFIENICDQICQKGSYTGTVSGLTFHYHSTDTTIDQQFMLVSLPNLQRSAFTEASITGLVNHGPVWRPQMFGWSVNGSNFPGKADRRQGITTGLAGETGYRCSLVQLPLCKK